MKEELKQLKQEVEQQLKSVTDLEALRELEVRFFGRKGKLTGLLKGLKDLPEGVRREMGAMANKMKQDLEELLEETKKGFDDLIEPQNKAAQVFDPTVPGMQVCAGTLHPVTQMRYDLNDAFLSLGFEVYEGSEISSEAYAFDCLNFPPEHPARESMDTYWIAGTEDKEGAKRLCLRPHLTGGSVRYMQTRKPPFRFVYPGRAFRSEATDASHERTFYQYEALIVDKEVPFSAGRVLVDTILERVFGKKVPIRMRSGFFPFVEPGFEIDMQCLVCEGSGCSVCKRVGWVEMMPGGPPHPNVLRAAQVDPDVWQGFYLNIGLDRLVMMKYGIDDIRLFHSGDLRFLKQF